MFFVASDVYFQKITGFAYMQRITTKQVAKRRRTIFIFLVSLLVIGSTSFSAVSERTPPLDPGHIELSNREIENQNLTRAEEALGKLAVSERLLTDDYQRNEFGSDWHMVKGCDMRNRILQRDLVDVVLDEDRCTVLSGVLERDPFTGKRIDFTRGLGTSNAVHIEHLVAVADAWEKGAQNFSNEKRHDFYNDPLNLIAVDGPTNIQKGDADASEWLPRPEYRCRYIARQIAVKLKYRLWVTKNEEEAMSNVLRTCPNQVLPIESDYVDAETEVTHRP